MNLKNWLHFHKELVKKKNNDSKKKYFLTPLCLPIISLKALGTLPVCFLRGGAIDAWLRINSWKNFLLSSSIGLWIYKTSSYCILKIHLTYTHIHTQHIKYRENYKLANYTKLQFLQLLVPFPMFIQHSCGMMVNLVLGLCSWEVQPHGLKKNWENDQLPKSLINYAIIY